MLRNISLGTYYPGDSFLHRLQARTKLVVLLWLAVALMIANQRVWYFAPFVIVVVLVVASILLSGISFHEIWRRTWLLILLTVIGVAPSVFSTSGTDDKILYSFGPINTTYSLVREVLLITFLVTLVVFLTTLPRVPVLGSFWRRSWLRRVRGIPLLLACASLLFFWLIQSIPPKNIFPIGPLIVTRSGVWSLMSVFVALLVLYILSVLLTMTTSPVALIEGLTLLLSPLRRLRFPVDDFALMVLLALRFIPTLLEEVEQLRKAQTARGADMERGTIRERFQSLTMLFVPLMQGIFRRASELATALEARGYEVEGHQTLLYEKPLARVDYIVLIATVGIMIGALLL